MDETSESLLLEWLILLLHELLASSSKQEAFSQFSQVPHTDIKVSDVTIAKFSCDFQLVPREHLECCNESCIYTFVLAGQLRANLRSGRVPWKENTSLARAPRKKRMILVAGQAKCHSKA